MKERSEVHPASLRRTGSRAVGVWVVRDGMGPIYAMSGGVPRKSERVLRQMHR